MRVLETCLYAADLDAAERFYRDVLELEPFARVEGRHVFFRVESAVFLLFHPDATAVLGQGVPPHGAVGPGHVAFAVPEAEIERWRARLADGGVAIEAEVAWPGGGRSLYVRDPAGNSVELAPSSIWGIAE